MSDTLFDDMCGVLEKIYAQEVESYQKKKALVMNADQKWINEVKLI